MRRLPTASTLPIRNGDFGTPRGQLADYSMSVHSAYNVGRVVGRVQYRKVDQALAVPVSHGDVLFVALFGPISMSELSPNA